MKTPAWLMTSHLALLLLACTGFSIISWMWGDYALNWNYFQYTYSNGWGQPYVSAYSLPQAICYIAAYTLGAVAFGILMFRHKLRLTGIATALCLIGALSFTLEATHWLWNHNLSVIASFPAVMIVLCLCIGIQITQLGRTNAQPCTV